ncbi:Ger(x)C family spore germination protein [Neobacillus niacini]|uniref:Ger(x)C family spore germination protein n=1 Tax=Neobacillus niacini TaxID=86668 RepID=UPI0021CB3FDA|nr:Ger(x)C family spore germination protein [Neobacillus niacini]MCM3764320.1 Ger(x)C family spore germination protein [Neobacillus niacini]
MKKRIAAALLTLMITPVLAGCWNQMELTELAFVLAIGIDKGKNGDKYDVTFQVVVPSNVGSAQSSGGGKGPPVVVYKSSGNTLTEASRRAKKMIPRVLYFAHTNILIIGEELAKEGILDIMDALDRDPELRTTTNMVIAKNARAEEMNSVLTNLDKLPVLKFTKTLEATQQRLGENFKINIDDVLSGIVSPGKEPVISGFFIQGEANKGISQENINKTRPPTMVTADGLAVIKNGKLAGWLNNEKARGALWMLNKMIGTYVDFSLNGKKDAVSVAPYLADTSISVSLKNGKPVATVNVKTIFKLSEINTNFDITDPLNTEVLEKAVAKQIKQSIESSIREAQKLKADIFGIGERLHRNNPENWKKMKKDWNSHFAEMDFEINVSTYFRETGLRNNPFFMNLDK